MATTNRHTSWQLAEINAMGRFIHWMAGVPAQEVR